MKKIIKSLIFMLVFLSISFLINFSVFSIFFNSIPLSSFLSLVTIMFILASIIASNSFRNPLTISISHISRFYIGAIFILFTLSVFFRLFNNVFMLNATIFTLLFVIIGSLIIVISSLNTKKIHHINHTIYSKKLDNNYTFVQISDVHIGSNTSKDLRKIVDDINTLNNIDFVFITGDLVDENISYEDLEPLNELKYKVYHIYGNHEYYINQENLSDILKKVNIERLKDASILIQNDIQIIGVDDHSRLKKTLPEISIDENRFVILLNHQPSEIEIAKQYNIDLFLCGHTHAGQIWPFNYLVKLQFKHVSGFHKEETFHLNVNSGTGTWGPKMRLGSKNEITILNVKKSQ